MEIKKIGMTFAKTISRKTIANGGDVVEKPLEGIRILDFTQFLSGPLCTLLLSDFGAEVVKIENPPLGDNTRYGPYIEKEASSHYAMRNRGKKSIVLNMKNEEHKKLFWILAKDADVVVDNYKPGTMEKFGITWEKLKEINPGIVFTSISGYGQSGPYADHAAFDQSVQAESGIMSITGGKEGSPLKCGASIADVSGGLAACIGTLMGIYDAVTTGQGRRVDVSMMDALVFSLGTRFSEYMRTGDLPTAEENPGGDPDLMESVNDFKAVSDHEQLKYRKLFVNAEFPNGVTFQVPGNPIHMSGMERKTEYFAAPLGYYTFEVLEKAADADTVHELFDPVLREVREEEKKIYEKS